MQWDTRSSYGGGGKEMELTSKANVSDRQDTWREMGSCLSSFPEGSTQLEKGIRARC